jgi:hypothetical protein
MAILVGMMLSLYMDSISRRMGGGSFVNHAEPLAFLARLQLLEVEKR